VMPPAEIDHPLSRDCDSSASHSAFLSKRISAAQADEAELEAR
jgi:hypothetical protein